MEIYDETKTNIIKNPDLSKGYLAYDKRVIKTIPATDEIKEQFHYEYKDYLDENGEVFGRDEIKVVDVEYQPAKPETYEFEDIQVYILFTEEELKNNKIRDLRERLTQLTEDIIQMNCGAVFENKEEIIKEFQEKHNELRLLEEKKPRLYEV